MLAGRMATVLTTGFKWIDEAMSVCGMIKGEFYVYMAVGKRKSMWDPDQQKIHYTAYDPAPLEFGLAESTDLLGNSKINSWSDCREEFHEFNQEVKRWYFHHNLPEGRGRSVSVFVEKVEDPKPKKSS